MLIILYNECLEYIPLIYGTELRTIEMSDDQEVYSLSNDEVQRITVEAMVHAELNDEPIYRSPCSAHSKLNVEQKLLLKQTKDMDEINEIFPIEDHITWRIVVENVDFYRIYERKREISSSKSTPKSSDTETVDSTFEYSSTEQITPEQTVETNSGRQFTSPQFDHEKSMDIWSIYTKHKYKSPQVSAVSRIVRKPRKRLWEQNDGCDYVQPNRKHLKTLSDESNGVRMSDDSDVENESKRKPMQYNNKLNDSKNQRSPLSPVNNEQDAFDMIRTTPIYQRGQPISNTNPQRKCSIRYSNHGNSSFATIAAPILSSDSDFESE